MTPSGAHGHMPHATSGAMLGPIKASQWAMDTTYELLWCIVIGIMTHESLTRRPQQLGSFDIYLLRGPTTIRSSNPIFTRQPSRFKHRCQHSSYQTLKNKWRIVTLSRRIRFRYTRHAHRAHLLEATIITSTTIALDTSERPPRRGSEDQTQIPHSLCFASSVKACTRMGTSRRGA
jgi:hypothetical protein